MVQWYYAWCMDVYSCIHTNHQPLAKLCYFHSTMHKRVNLLQCHIFLIRIKILCSQRHQKGGAKFGLKTWNHDWHWAEYCMYCYKAVKLSNTRKWYEIYKIDTSMTTIYNCITIFYEWISHDCITKPHTLLFSKHSSWYIIEYVL